MVIYNNITEKLKAAGISSSSLRQAGILSESTMTRLRRNEPITTDTLDILCQLLHCTPNDLITIRFNEYAGTEHAAETETPVEEPVLS